MGNERKSPVDNRQRRGGWPFNYLGLMNGMNKVEKQAFKLYALEEARKILQAERDYTPFVLPKRKEVLAPPINIASARAAVNEAFSVSETLPPLDNSAIHAIIDPKLPETATVERLDNVA